jgi:hypothetical protein
MTAKLSHFHLSAATEKQAENQGAVLPVAAMQRIFINLPARARVPSPDPSVTAEAGRVARTFNLFHERRRAASGSLKNIEQSLTHRE